MIKLTKTLLLFSILFFWFLIQNTFWAWKCPEYNEVNPISVWSQIDWCLNWSKLVNPSSWVEIKTGFKEKVAKFTKTLWWILAIFAVWAIAWGSFKMVISGGVEWDIKKGKDAIKWWMVWFLVVVSSSAVILVVVEVMYSIG